MKILILTLAFISLHSFAQDYKCGKVIWNQKPKIENGFFIGDLSGECQITPKNNGDIKLVEAYFEQELKKGTTTTYESEVADDSLGIPGRRFDLGQRTDEGEIRNLIRLGSDGINVFIYDAASKKINFSGFASYLKKLDTRTEVRRSGENTFVVKLRSYTKVDKPRIAPSDVFFKIAQKNSIEQFEKQLKRLAVTISQNI